MHSTDLTPGLRTIDLILRSSLVILWVATIGWFLGFIFWVFIWPHYRMWHDRRKYGDPRLYGHDTMKEVYDEFRHNR